MYLMATIAGCRPVPDHPKEYKEAGRLPIVFPSDNGATIPCNIAPINFRLKEPGNDLFVSIKGHHSILEQGFKGNKTNFRVDSWLKFLSDNKGDSILFTLYQCQDNKWTKYKPFSYFVAQEPIDDYLVYRLIYPGYQAWNKMGIYQRCLSDFKVETILDNHIMPMTCMNCHSMASNNPDHMLLHLRENNSGTILISGDKVQKLETKTPTTFSSVSFPYWHPSAKYVAFSIDKVRQLFPSIGHERAHAFDAESDMVIYDVEKNEFFTSPLLFSKDAYEAFPCFSPEGNRLFFVSAKAVPMPENIKKIRYSLCSLSFDPKTAALGSVVDTLISASSLGKSVTMPRVSPNGKYILVTIADQGNFPAYNKEADLYMYHLKDSTLVRMDALNSNDVESYHSWSSNGRWIVFSSRRMDGLYMNAYLAYIDENGNPKKPFLLPQEDADFHQKFLYSFNIPEFSIKRISVNPYLIEEVAKKSEGEQVKFENTH